MKPYVEFLKKEWMETVRTNKLLILTCIFLVFGIINPAAAKLMPQIMEMAMNDYGIADLGTIEITDYDSWAQFFKNVSTVLLVFLVMFSGIITTEYQKETLVQIFTKGIRPHTVFLAKLSVVLSLWTVGYWSAAAITYGYNEYFWGNDVSKHIVTALFFYYLFAIWLISVLFLLSTVVVGNINVLFGVAVIYGIDLLAGIFDKLLPYIPEKLSSCLMLLNGETVPGDYTKSVIITMGITILVVGTGYYLIDKKRI